MSADPPSKDPRISAIFYYFEHHTNIANGRTLGRKIGVVQEFVLKKYLQADPELRRRMYLEQKLTGASGASHKVEFSWYAIKPQSRLVVGDALVPALVIVAIDERSGVVKVSGDWNGPPARIQVKEGVRLPSRVRDFLAPLNLDIRLTGLTPDSVSADIIDRSKLLASLESKRVGAQRFSGSDKLGSGIQTIEKAKQASLVAIDLDVEYNKNAKPLGKPTNKKQLLSFVALGNGVHWTEKDKAVLGTYVDYTFLVHDEAIIRYAEFVRGLKGGALVLKDFSDYFKGMTKQRPDAFVVTDADFSIIVPQTETRPLRQVVKEHLERVNPI